MYDDFTTKEALSTTETIGYVRCAIENTQPVYNAIKRFMDCSAPMGRTDFALLCVLIITDYMQEIENCFPWLLIIPYDVIDALDLIITEWED